MGKVFGLGALVLGASLVFAMPAVGQDGEDGGDDNQATVQSNENDRICRRVRTTGSRITERICMSRAEWADLREESQEALRDNERNSGQNTATTGAN